MLSPAFSLGKGLSNMRTATITFCVACVLAIVCFPCPLIAKDAGAEARFEQSMDLLELQMQMQVLDRFRNITAGPNGQPQGHYFPDNQIRALSEQVESLREQIGISLERDIEKVEKRSADERKIDQAEAESLKQLTLSLGRKALKLMGKESQRYAELRNKLDQLEQKRTKNAIVIARFIEEQVRPHLGSADAEWRQSAKKTFRGNVNDLNRLSNTLVYREKRRSQRDSAVAMLKAFDQSIETGTNVYGKLNKLRESMNKTPAELFSNRLQSDFESRVESEATHRLERSLRPHYGADAPQIAQQRVKTGMSLIKKMNQARAGAAALESDITLRRYPTALGTAKGFTVLGAIYSFVIETVDEIDKVGVLDPLLEVAKFYGEAINLVPGIAQKVARLQDRRFQGILGVSSDDAWSVVKHELGEAQLSSSGLRNVFGLEIAVGQGRREDSPGAPFYMLVDKDIDPRGYIDLTFEKYHRLAQALADERFLFARSEAERSTGDFLSGLYKNYDNRPLSTHRAPGFEQDWARRTTQTPFGVEDLRRLAEGGSVQYRGRQWSAASLAAEREGKLRMLVIDQIVAAVGGEVNNANAHRWLTFSEILWSHKEPLTPTETLELFGRFLKTLSAVTVHDTLEARARERRLKRLARLQASLPFIRIVSPGDLRPGARVYLEAAVIASSLPEDEQVQGDIVWTLPSWAASQQGKQGLTLRNGLQYVRRDLTIPANLKDRSFTVRAELTVPEVFASRVRPFALSEATFYFDRDDEPTEQEIGASVTPVETETVWVLTEEIKNPKKRKARRESGGEVNYYLDQVTFGGSSGTIHHVKKRKGKLEADWVFAFSFSQPPRVLHKEQAFDIQVRATAGGAKQDMVYSASHAMTSRGISQQYEGGKNSKHCFVGRSDVNRPVVAQDSGVIHCKVTGRGSELWMQLGSYTTPLIRYVYKKQEVAVQPKSGL